MGSFSKYFTIGEMYRSQTAKVRGIDNYPHDESHYNALQNLAITNLDRVREHFYLKYRVPLKLSIAYRSPRVNKLVGGAKNSQHMYGEAADYDYEWAGISNKHLLRELCGIAMPFDKIIYEFGRWIHHSHSSRGQQRGIYMEAYKNRWNRTKYRQLPKWYVGVLVNEDYKPDSELLVEHQRILHTLGYYGGLIDGASGPITRHAINKYRNNNKILTLHTINDQLRYDIDKYKIRYPVTFE